MIDTTRNAAHGLNVLPPVAQVLDEVAPAPGPMDRHDAAHANTLASNVAKAVTLEGQRFSGTVFAAPSSALL
jgi:hypothetical protein